MAEKIVIKEADKTDDPQCVFCGRQFKPGESCVLSSDHGVICPQMEGCKESREYFESLERKDLSRDRCNRPFCERCGYSHNARCEGPQPGKMGWCYKHQKYHSATSI